MVLPRIGGMDMIDIIRTKRDGGALSTGEIRWVIDAYTHGRVAEEQMAALAMAIVLRGMDRREIADWTNAMIDSGARMRWEGSVDKHSTGGVGDKITLPLGPLVAAHGVFVPQLSGRGLGHTGGTLDKLESIPGMICEMSEDMFMQQVNKIGLAIVGQTGHLTPADGKLYALRDETATVMSKPLIASSIMSKKLAAGCKNIVLDVKYGSGAFMKTKEDAVELAEIMIGIGQKAGRRMTAVISSMEEPLGHNVGNSLEVIEAIQTLSGDGPRDLLELSTTLAGLMYSSCFDTPFEKAKELALETIRSGAAKDRLRLMVKAQRGDSNLVDHPECFETSRFTQVIRATQSGYVTNMDTEGIGLASCILGAGRETMDDAVDYSAGIQILKKTGEPVQVGDTLAILRTKRERSLRDAEDRYLSSLTISEEEPEKEPLIYKILEG